MLRPPRKLVCRHEVLSFLLGLTIIAASPPEETANFLRLSFVGSYLVTYFDLMVVLACFACFWTAELRLTRGESAVYKALGLVIVTRIASLLFASEVSPQQVISVLRYIETLLVLIVLANFLATAVNRYCFLAGIVLGTVLESCGGLFTFFASNGEARGIWLGSDNYKIQVYALLVCCLALTQQRHRILRIVCVCGLLLSIAVTETRRAFLIFAIALAITLWQRRSSLSRLAMVSLAGTAIVALVFLAAVPSVADTSVADTSVGRIDELWTGGGTVGYRIVLWKMAAAAYLSHPVTGIGSGGFARQQNALYYYISDAFDPEYDKAYGSLSTHNTVLGVASETGSLGLIAYFIWVAAVGSFVIKALRLGGPEAEPYLIAACACVLAMLLEDWWGQASFMPPATCLLGLISGWCRSHGQTTALQLAAVARQR